MRRILVQKLSLVCGEPAAALDVRLCQECISNVDMQVLPKRFD